MRWIVVACRVVLGALFLWAAATKVPDLAAFAQDVANYRLLPPAAVPYVAAALVGIEILVGLALVTGYAARAGGLVAAGMLVAFVAGLSQALLRGIDLRCGCFGGEDAATWGTVVRDLAMLVPAVVVTWRGRDRDRAPARSRAAA